MRVASLAQPTEPRVDHSTNFSAILPRPDEKPTADVSKQCAQTLSGAAWRTMDDMREKLFHSFFAKVVAPIRVALAASLRVPDFR